MKRKPIKTFTVTDKHGEVIISYEDGECIAKNGYTVYLNGEGMIEE